MRHIIIGIIVWAGIGVIVLPFMLDGQGIEQIESQQAPASVAITDLELAPITDDVFKESISITPDPVPAPVDTPLDDDKKALLADKNDSAIKSNSQSRDTDTVAVPNLTNEIAPDTAGTVQKTNIDEKNKATSSSNTSDQTPPKEQADVLASIAIIDTGWTIQLGSFKNKKNAVTLTEKMNRSGYPTFVQTKGAFVQVHVGPVTTRKQAEQFKKQIKTDKGIEGIILTYKRS